MAVTNLNIITADNFVITDTRCGVTVRWKHNHRVLQTFMGYDARERATSYITFLLDWYSNPDNASVIASNKALMNLYRRSNKRNK